MELAFHDHSPEGLLIAEPSGELDLYSASEFASGVLGRMRAGLAAVILAMDGVTYLDSSGTGAIIRILYRARSLGAGLSLVGLRKGPRQVLEMVNLLGLIGVHGTLEEAVSAAAGAAGAPGRPRIQ